jgi:intracellular sulfur oxidation DsrE/DsrF family protein
LSGCGEDNAPSPATEIAQTSPVVPSIPVHTQTQFTIGNKRYLFDVTGHSIEELEALLQRTEEITRDIPADFEHLEIVLILHGPDLDWFKKENYGKNRQMVDLAAKLDGLDIIDIKACATAMGSRGIDSNDLPAFIETVPYAPDEIARLQEQDYVTL